MPICIICLYFLLVSKLVDAVFGIIKNVLAEISDYICFTALD